MKTVLIVDDEYDLLQALCAVLEIEGYRVLSAGDGRSALEELADVVPDLIITDVMMPHVSGYELVAAARGMPRCKAVPVILMSAMDEAVHKRGDWNVLLHKPFTLDALVEAVGRLIGPP